MDLEQLRQLQERPEPFAPGEPQFWDAPHISAQMLAAHLDPATDRASRRPETIDRSVAWLVESLNLQPGDAVLDLGCGPGLYALRLARRGLRVTGVDISSRSLEYARESARQRGLQIEYRHQNYLDLNDEGLYDLALLIYGDFCTFSQPQRAQILHNVHRALKPGGIFALDVSTRELRKRRHSVNRWYVAGEGFWAPGLHLVLETGFDYPEQSLHLDQVVVVEPSGATSVYRMWFQDFTRDSITAELERGGFLVLSSWNDLAGSPHTEGAEWIGVAARKQP